MSVEPAIGIYVHVPFCPHICPYCDFVKTSKVSRKILSQYFEGLLIQLSRLRPMFLNPNKSQSPELNSPNPKKQKVPATLYFGGGTPGMLSGNLFQELVAELQKDFEILEFSVEMNPFTLSENKVTGFLDLGCNRFTLGVQSVCPSTLKFLGRKHTRQEIENSLQSIRQISSQRGGVGAQVQADLIYGLRRGVRGLSLSEEVETLLTWGATGVSCYALSLEPRTLFGSTENADDDTAADDYREILIATQRAGLRQVETSNFSTQMPLHNSIYWTGKPYLGLGPGGHGLVPNSSERPFGQRYRTGPAQYQTSKPGDDILEFEPQIGTENKPPQAKEQRESDPFAVHWEPLRSHDDFRKEMLFTLSRLESGVPLSWIDEQFGSHKSAFQSPKLSRALAEGLLTLREGTFQISPLEKIRGDSWVLELITALCEK